MGDILAENKNTGEQAWFTLEQWNNLKKTGHLNWRILDDSRLLPEKVEAEVFETEVIPQIIEGELDVEFIDWRKKLIEEEIKFHPRIKDQEKLKKIYQDAIAEKGKSEENK